MGTSANDLERKKPVAGMNSVFSPLIGFAVRLIALFIPDPDAGHMGLRGIYSFVGIVLLASLTGGISAAIAFARREKYWALPLLGLILSSSPFLYLIRFGGH